MNESGSEKSPKENVRNGNICRRANRDYRTWWKKEMLTMNHRKQQPRRREDWSMPKWRHRLRYRAYLKSNPGEKSANVSCGSRVDDVFAPHVQPRCIMKGISVGKEIQISPPFAVAVTQASRLIGAQNVLRHEMCGMLSSISKRIIISRNFALKHVPALQVHAYTEGPMFTSICNREAEIFLSSAKTN